MAGCWGGRWLQWEEDPDEDTVSEHKQHCSGSSGDVLCLAVTPDGLLATGELAAGTEVGCEMRKDWRPSRPMDRYKFKGADAHP